MLHLTTTVFSPKVNHRETLKLDKLFLTLIYHGTVSHHNQFLCTSTSSVKNHQSIRSIYLMVIRAVYSRKSDCLVKTLHFMEYQRKAL